MWHLHWCRRTLERERIFFEIRRDRARAVRYEAEEQLELSWSTADYLRISESSVPLPSRDCDCGGIVPGFESALTGERDCYDAQKALLADSLWPLIVLPLIAIPGALWGVTRDLA